MTDERLAQITHPSPLEAELIAEIHRLRQLAGEVVGDLAYMGDYLFWKHYRHDLEENPWLEKHNPFPEGCPYFPETLDRKKGSEKE